jgi:hypothetical protein
MNGKLVTVPGVILAFAVMHPLQAHHSISMFDLTTPIWVEGRVVAYEAVNPHATMVLEERVEGAVRRWTVEGPSLRRISQMGMEPEVGDDIAVCGFDLKEGTTTRSSTADPYGRSDQFIHGHTLSMPDGHWELFGSYGSLAECIRSSGERRESWLAFLDSGDPRAREFWCGQRRGILRRSASSDWAASLVAFVEEINGLMADPCE